MVEAGRLLALAGDLVTAYLRGATDCPAPVRDEATIRTAGHVQRRAGYGLIAGRMKAGGVQLDLEPTAVSPVRQSGAAALLSPYVRRTA